MTKTKKALKTISEAFVAAFAKHDGETMTAAEMVEALAGERWGKTTVGTQLHRQALKPNGVVVKEGRGSFRLRREDEMPAAPVEAPQEKSEAKGSSKNPTRKTGPKSVQSVQDLDKILADNDEAQDAEAMVSDLTPKAKTPRKRSTARKPKAGPKQLASMLNPKQPSE